MRVLRNKKNVRDIVEKLLVVAIIFLFLVINFTVYAAEETNVSEVAEEVKGGVEEGVTEETNESDVPDDLCFGIDCEDSEVICEDGFVASCVNTCDSQTGECGPCTLDCTGHDILVGNETEATNETENDPEPTNLSENLELEVFYSGKFIRGDSKEIKAVVTNNGLDVQNVALDWILPTDSQIVGGDQIKQCGDLNSGESCESIIHLEILDVSMLGRGEIKVIVRFENEN